MLILSADASRFDIRLSSMLYTAFSLHTHAVDMLEWNYTLRDYPILIDISWSHVFFFLQSFMSPRFAGGPRGPPIRMGNQVEVTLTRIMDAQHVCKTAASLCVLCPLAARRRARSSSHAAQHGPNTTTRCDAALYNRIKRIKDFLSSLSSHVSFPPCRPS